MWRIHCGNVALKISIIMNKESERRKKKWKNRDIYVLGFFRKNVKDQPENTGLSSFLVANNWYTQKPTLGVTQYFSMFKKILAFIVKMKLATQECDESMV